MPARGQGSKQKAARRRSGLKALKGIAASREGRDKRTRGSKFLRGALTARRRKAVFAALSAKKALCPKAKGSDNRVC